MSALNVFLLWDQEDIQGNLLVPLHHSPYLQGWDAWSMCTVLLPSGPAPHPTPVGRAALQFLPSVDP